MDRVEQQLDLFATVNGTYKIKGKLYLIQLFSGIGSQCKALKVLGIDFTDYKTCEWTDKSIIGYNLIHTRDFTDYSKDLTKQELINYLQGNISTDYNEPCDCSKKNEEWLRKVYNSCKATHNLMNICNVKGQDLDIKEDGTTLISWSYPCQDLSLAGTGAGMKEGSGTRSSLCFEVLRIIQELTPKQREKVVMIMENVPAAVGSKAIKDFQEVEKRLRDMGFQNHIQIMNLKNYGLPQNRERVFMISCFGDYQFPAKIPLKYRLKDFLEHSVDEKYYLTDKQIKDISNWNAYEKPLLKMERTDGGGCSPTITTRTSEMTSSIILHQEYLGTYQYDKSDNFMKGKNRFNPNKQLSDTLQTTQKEGIVIKEATKLGYKVANEGDGVDISSRIETHRGTVQKGIIQTIKANIDVGVVVKDEK